MEQLALMVSVAARVTPRVKKIVSLATQVALFTMYCDVVTAVLATQIARLTLALPVPWLQMLRVDNTAALPDGTVYSVVIVFAVGVICPKTLYVVAIDYIPGSKKGLKLSPPPLAVIPVS